MLKKKIIPEILPLLLLAIPVILFFFRLFYPQSSIFMIPDFGESDVLHFNLPLKQILSSSLKTHEFPLWTKYLANGFPVLAEGQIGTFYLPNLVLFRFLPLILAYNLNLVLSFTLAIIGTYLFGRCLGLSRISGMFAAVFFGFSGFLAVHLNHFNTIQTSCLAPLVFWASYLLWRKPSPRYSVLFAFILSQQIFTGYFPMVFISLTGVFFFLTGLFLFKYTGNGKKDLRKRIFYFIIGLTFTLLFSAIQLLPTIELWSQSGRSGGLDYDTATSFPYPGKHLLSFLNPYLFGNPANGSYPPYSSNWGIFWENTGYVGLLTLFLAGAGLIFRRKRYVSVFLCLLAASLFLVPGKNSPLYFVFSFPPFNLFRVPSRFLLLTVFNLSVLASLSLNEIYARLRRKKILAVLVTIFVMVTFFLDEFNFSYNYPPISSAKKWTDPPKSVLTLKDKEGRIFSVGFPKVWNEIFLKSGWKTMEPYEYLNNSLYPNLNVLFSLPGVNINTGGLIPRRVSLLNDLLTPSQDIPPVTLNLLSLNHVTHIISSQTIEIPGLTLMSKTGNGKNIPAFFIYQNTEVEPRAYFAFKTKKVETVQQLLANLGEKDFLAGNYALVEDDSIRMADNKDASGLALIIKDTDNEVIINARTDASGLLILSDTNYPGWESYLDGKKTKIFSVNLTQRGIMVPPGNHEVKYTLHSAAFEMGKILTTLSLLTASLMMFRLPLFYSRKF